MSDQSQVQVACDSIQDVLSNAYQSFLNTNTLTIVSWEGASSFFFVQKPSEVKVFFRSSLHTPVE